MKVRLHDASEIAWRRIGDIPLGDMRQYIDPGELASHVGFHEVGDAATPQLMEMRLEPDALVTPHHHEVSEILYVVEGELHFGDRVLGAGGSVFVPGGATYSFRAGPQGLRMLNFRPVADQSFHPKKR